MEELKNYLSNVTKLTNYLIINSHADFDHFLGNAAFPNSEIVSSVACYKAMKKQTRKGIQKNMGLFCHLGKKSFYRPKHLKLAKYFWKIKLVSVISESTL